MILDVTGKKAVLPDWLAWLTLASGGFLVAALVLAVIAAFAGGLSWATAAAACGAVGFGVLLVSLLTAQRKSDKFLGQEWRLGHGVADTMAHEPRALIS